MKRAIKRIDWLSPTVAYPMVYLFYYAFGYVQWERLKMFEYRAEVPWILLAGWVAFLLGTVSVTQAKRINNHDTRQNVCLVLNQNNAKEMVLIPSPLPTGMTLERLAVPFIVVGLAGVGLIIAEQGILIWNESLRLTVNAKFKFLSSAFWFGMLMWAYAEVVRTGKVRRALIVIYLAVVVILLIAYRTPVAILLLAGLYLLHYGFRHLHYWQLVLFAISVILLMVVLDELRTPQAVDRSYEQERAQAEEAIIKENTRDLFIGETDVPKEGLGKPQDVAKTPWQRTLISATTPSMSGQVAVSKILDYTRSEGPLYGELHVAIFTSVLPGQPGPRAMVTEIVNQVSDRVVTSEGRTTTPTMVGQLLLDFGLSGVVAGLFLWGSFLTWMYRRFLERQDVLSLLLYGYSMSISLIAIHTGLLDLVLYLFLAFLLLLAAVSDRRALREELTK